jgi:hypothetical protein
MLTYLRSLYLPRAPAAARATAVRLDLVLTPLERGGPLPSDVVEDQPAELDAAWEAVRSLYPRL